MKKDINIFQIVLIAIAALSAIGGLIAFSFYKSDSDVEKIGPVTIWGTMEADAFKDLKDLVQIDESIMVKLDHVTYVQKKQDLFTEQFVEALATGKGPDIVILPHSMILLNQNKLLPISYESYSERLFKDSFIEGADVLRDVNGIIGLPLSVDPMIMYWNRDLFKRELLINPPKVWENVMAMTPKLSITDDKGNVFRSAVALGQFSNIDYAKEILTTLMQQAGSNVVNRKERVNAEMGNYTITEPDLNTKGNYLIPPAEAALRFFGQFTDPTKDVYSWNRSLDTDSNQFLSGDLAMYFGKSSRYDEFKKINPNLNFDVAVIPQKSGGIPVTYGDFTAISIVKNTKRTTDAFQTLSVITTPKVANALSSVLNLPPARKDVLGYKQTEAAKAIFFQSALLAKAFYDPYPKETYEIFENITGLYTSGQVGLSQAINLASQQLSALFN